MNIKIKILITTLFILMFCNTSMAITETHKWEEYISFADDYSFSLGGIYFTRFDHISTIDIKNIEGLYFASSSFDTNKIDAGFTKDTEYYNVQFKIGSNVLGSGIAGYSKGTSRTFVNYWIQSDEGLLSLSYTGSQEIDVIGFPDIHQVKNSFRAGAGTYPNYNFLPVKSLGVYRDYGGGNMDIHYYTHRYFYNEIEINDNGYTTTIDIYKTQGNTSKFLITDPSKLIDETILNYDDVWTGTVNETVSIYGINYADNIFSYIYNREEAPGTSTLTTDKTYYNTSEIIEISFTDIDILYNECDEHICEKPYELHILYPISDPYKQYGTKFIYPLTYNLEDETIYLNTSFLHPENTYILGIVGINGYYGLHDDILIFSDSFTVYPDEQYLSVSCDSESSCYTYNNADITIYYKINNNSNIIIKDNDNNIINTYHNIINSGEILYHIPDDLNYINTYPNWKVYLNNTEYSTSFNKGVTVYWSQFQTPTPTPTYTPQPTPDINISDTIDEFKTETQPIKDLIFGLSEIVIDNPDYNKDSIVDENEINHWFNSLIPLCIIFLLIVLYIGIKKQRE